MIKLLGAKRILLILILLGINIFFAAVLYMYLTPEQLKKQRELRTLNGQVASVRGDIDRMQIEFEQLEEQQAEFDILKADGFFKNQGRRQAELVFKRIQDESKVISAVATVRAGVVEDSVEAQKAGHKILKSPVDIRIEAMDDTDVFRYLYLIDEFFPGYVTIESIKLERDAEITGTVLRSISAGGNPPLVHADVKALWRTMIPEGSVLAPEEKGR